MRSAGQQSLSTTASAISHHWHGFQQPCHPTPPDHQRVFEAVVQAFDRDLRQGSAALSVMAGRPVRATAIFLGGDGEQGRFGAPGGGAGSIRAVRRQ